MDEDYLPAKKALAILGVKSSTLYSYVSRGVIRRIRTKANRESLYSRSDIEKQLARRGARRGHRATAGASLMWGAPVLETGLCYIDNHGPSFRGQNFRHFIDECISFERTAEFLWTGILPSGEINWSAKRVRPGAGGIPQIMGEEVLLQLLHLQDGPTLDSTLEVARSTIATVAWPGSKFDSGYSTAARLARRWGVAGSEKIIEAALIASLEHELNNSTFTARIVASTGAHILQCLLAAAAAHSGPRHGGASLELEKFLSLQSSERAMMKAAREALTAGKMIPGFGHPLYPAGDPRARLIIDLLNAFDSKNLRRSKIGKLIEFVIKESAQAPNIDAGLVALRAVLNSPSDTAATIFFTARLGGWVAHILEQRQRDIILRPRAHYTGPLGPS